MIKKNINTLGRVARACAAAALLFFAYKEKSWVYFLLSLFVFFEAIMSWCVVYQILGINRCSLPKKKS